ncbi:unnamed protein product [Adineta steineri]|uniref:Uncharacterized protein n=1 Tax=Adineta steineri TaxID=433720 RepID=A0A815TMR2_9BILA|nr:unnamed protein product [Adineta steineri]CAF4144448.1 unnamed protein product [Adineta steineri]
MYLNLVLIFIINFISESSTFSTYLNQTTTTTYTNCLYPNRSKFTRPNSDTRNYYFHSIDINLLLTGSYTFTSNSTIDIYGSFHHSTIDLTNPYKSMITFDDNGGNNKQFEIKLGLLSKNPYNLMVTTAIPNITGCFTIIVKGPTIVHLFSNNIFFRELTTTTTTTTDPPIITSTYSGMLSTNSLLYSRLYNYMNPNYYYEAFEMIISESGIYTFMSEASIDTYGYLYDGLFDPLFPSVNLIGEDDNGNDNYQFLIKMSLRNKYKYILIITTSRERVIGDFLINVKGPSSVNLTPINQTISIYNNILSINSSTYSRFRLDENIACYYYQAIQIKTDTNGIYSFISNSSMDTYGYIYNNSFNPLYSSQNLIKSDDNSGNNRQFRINLPLVSHHTYVLIITTQEENIKGNFSIKVIGRNKVYFYLIPRTINTQSCIDRPSYSYNFNDDKSCRTLAAVIVTGASFWIMILVVCCCCCFKRCRGKDNSNQQSNSSEQNQNDDPPSYQSVIPSIIHH